jgi:NADH-quinone oxidoreductase subunit N
MSPQEFVAPGVEWFHLSPLVALVAGALTLLVVGALTPRWPRGWYAGVAAVSATTAGVLAWIQWDDATGDGATTLVAGALAFDAMALFFTVTICAATVLVVLVTDDELRCERVDGPEVHALMLVAAAGAVVMATANDLIVLFVGLETLSLALYVLAASDRRRAGGREAGLKYFILGGFASAVFLYGIALLYGATSSTNISEIVTSFQQQVLVAGNEGFVLAGIALLVVGLAFKVSAVPFHAWTPDVYQGAPNHVTGFMASVGKVAAFGAMLRVLVVALPAYRDDWRPVVWMLALLSLAGGSLLAAVQTDVKRMLAYSSISHAGFVLVGMEAAGHTAGTALGAGVSTVAMYLPLYSFLTVGSFAVVALVARHHGGSTSIDTFVGLARRRPTLAAAFTVLLLAQAGVPFTSGFVAKWGVVQAAVEQESYALAIIAMVAAVVAAFMYLRIMVAVWLTDAPADGARERVPVGAGLAIAVAVVVTLVVGVWPEWMLDAADRVVAVAG